MIKGIASNVSGKLLLTLFHRWSLMWFVFECSLVSTWGPHSCPASFFLPLFENPVSRCNEQPV